MDSLHIAYLTMYTRMLLLIKDGKVDDAVSANATYTNLKTDEKALGLPESR